MTCTTRHTSRSCGTAALILAPLEKAQSLYALYGAGGENMFLYSIHCPATGQYETGAGHLQDAVTLRRDCVMSSSAGGRRVNFRAGEKIIGGLS